MHGQNHIKFICTVGYLESQVFARCVNPGL